MESDLTATFSPTSRSRHAAWGALVFGLVSFALLWFLNTAYRRVYVPRLDDVTELVDGLLLLPGARWEDWFTQGQTHFFDAYPEWPWGLGGFARPAFQCLVYLAHFLFGRNWSSYLAINYLAVAGAAAVAFAIARTAIRLGIGLSLVAASLVLLAPAIWENSIWEVGFASEPLAGLFVGCAFLAVVVRRDLLCLALLCTAVLTKETAVWAPFAAALTVLLRPGAGETPRHRALAAAAMLLPLAMWLGMRLSFFGGIGGTYASPHYTPLSLFLEVTGWKLTHLPDLLVRWDYSVRRGQWPLVDRTIKIALALFVLMLLILWGQRALRAAISRVGEAVRERRLRVAHDPSLVTTWAAMGIVFYFALTLPDLRYATSAVIFMWPALVGEIRTRHKVLLHVSLVACCVLSLERTAHYLIAMNPPSAETNTSKLFNAVVAMNAALREVPSGFRQVYVLSAGDDLSDVAPDYLRAFLDVPMEIVRVIDVEWDCEGPYDRIVFEHDNVDGVVTLSATLPDCASFLFQAATFDSRLLVDGRLRRSDSISYELPEAHPAEHIAPRSPVLELGRKMTAHIRPRGPARFIVEHAGPDGGLVWFDVP